MNPIYFPFTYTIKPTVDALGVFFRKSTVYQPLKGMIPENMHKLAEKGMIDIRVPAGNNEDEVALAITDYTNWSGSFHGNKGVGVDFIKTRQGEVPFFNETSVSQLKADIKTRSKNVKQEGKIDPIFNAKLFLGIAQEFDQSDISMQGNLNQVDQMEQELFQNLRGENRSGEAAQRDTHSQYANDTRSYMIAERLNAWTRLLHHDVEHNEMELPGVYLTSSRTVFEFVLDIFPDSVKIFHLQSRYNENDTSSGDELWQNDLQKNLENLLMDPNPNLPKEITPPERHGANGKKVSLTLNMIPGENPCAFLERVSGSSFKWPDTGKNNKIMSTIVGLIDNCPESLNML